MAAMYDVVSSPQCSTQDGAVMFGEKCKETTFSVGLRTPSLDCENVIATKDVCEVEHTKSAQQKQSKCFIAILVCVSMIVVLMTLSAFLLASLSYSPCVCEESTSKINLFSSQLDHIRIQTQHTEEKWEDSASKIDSIRSQLDQLSNETLQIKQTTSTIDYFSIQHQKFASATENNITQLKNYVSSLQEQFIVEQVSGIVLPSSI